MSLPLFDLLRLTWKSMSSDLTRSGLTALGVFMGVSAVSATLNIQSITTAQIDAKLAARDKPYVVPYVYSTTGFDQPTLGETDQQALRQAIPTIRSISSVGDVYSIQSVQYEAQEASDLRVRSVSLNYLETTGRQMVLGRFFNQGDFDQYRPVAIVDEQLADTLFQGEDPIRKAIYAAGTRLIVVGVTQTKTRGEESKTTGTLWITENFAVAIQGGFRFSSLQISPNRLEEIKELKEKTEQTLKQRYPQMEIYIGDNAEDLLKEKETQEISSRALMVVGLIALMIGGVGIANITVATVMERTKEIGIRRAIGATQAEIMFQFILEAVLLSLVGGGLAIATIHGITQFTTTKIIQTPYQFSTRNAAMAMGAAVAVGVGASFLPALRTTRIDIVKALRSE
ncbi:MAG: ABC transporter permease [Oculatellaceae cyanobacterium Prado106]|jgi:putative ABC transport system permease protein|nr:ABC transporter permease [Oculatellaceae cyanobacterium Prado106]